MSVYTTVNLRLENIWCIRKSEYGCVTHIDYIHYEKSARSSLMFYNSDTRCMLARCGGWGHWWRTSWCMGSILVGNPDGRVLVGRSWGDPGGDPEGVAPAH